MKLIGLVIAASAALFAVGRAEALPIAPGPGGFDAPIVLARGGCGFGAHRGPFGDAA